MGAKITIDSATMMNKGLELIEAVWLFSMPPERVDIVVHRESVVHSLIEFADHSVIAQMGVPDMRIPIQYALTYPERHVSPVEQLSLAAFGALHFAEPDYEAFPLIQVCRRAILRGGVYPAVANAAMRRRIASSARESSAFWRSANWWPRLRSVRPTDQITHWMISVRRVRPRGSLYANRQKPKLFDMKEVTRY